MRYTRRDAARIALRRVGENESAGGRLERLIGTASALTARKQQPPAPARAAKPPPDGGPQWLAAALFALALGLRLLFWQADDHIEYTVAFR